MTEPNTGEWGSRRQQQADTMKSQNFTYSLDSKVNLPIDSGKDVNELAWMDLRVTEMLHERSGKTKPPCYDSRPQKKGGHKNLGR